MLVMFSAWICNKSFLFVDLGASPVEAKTSFSSWYVRHGMLVCTLVNIRIRNG